MLLLYNRGATNSKSHLYLCFPDAIRHMDLDECEEHPEVCLYFHAQFRGGDLSHSVRIHQPVPDLEI